MSIHDTISGDVPEQDGEEQRPERGGHPVLVVFDKAELTDWKILSRADTRIGRDAEADLALHDDTASRLHASIAYLNIDDPGTFPQCVIRDLGSRNGTYLNGRRLSTAEPLAPGDRIRIGATTLLFQVRTEEEILADNRLRAMATTDELTGLLNRAFLAIQARREVDRAQRYHRPLTCILLDIDDFKKINDTYGHPVGDEVLEQIGALLAQRKRAHDVAARYGGEEFCLLLPETTLPGAVVVAERIRIAIENHVFHAEGGIELKVTASFGVAEINPHDGHYFERLVGRADVGLYRSKSSGKNRVSSAMIGDEPTR